MNHIDWQLICSLPIGTPLISFPYASKRIEGNVYQVSDTCFLLANDYPYPFGTEAEGGPFLWGIVWAVSLGAAMRIFRYKIELDEGLEPASPPQEILPEGYVTTFQEALELDWQWVLSQDFTPDYVFSNSTLETRSHRLYFREDLPPPNARPFAILWGMEDPSANPRKRSTGE